MKTRVVEYTERWTTGGIESYILNLVRYLDHNKFEIRIVVAQKETNMYDNELEQYGCHVESILKEIDKNPIRRIIKNQKSFKQFFLYAPCDVLHLHICQGVSLGYAKMAKEIGVTKVISHCHNAEFGEGHKTIKLLGHMYGKHIYEKYVDTKIACSDLAARWLYTKKNIEDGNVIIAKYIVGVHDFAFSVSSRNTLRKYYKLNEDTKVYLNIGRLHYQKNQKFLLEIFREIIKRETNCKLVLIGAGELKNEIHSYARQLGIIKKVIFIEETRNVSAFMSMADIFILPSLFEGNPIVGMEAQASGLPCVFSSAITKQAKVIDTTCYLSLSKGSDIWATRITEIKLSSPTYRKSCVEIVKMNGYDIHKQIEEISQIYWEK